MVRETIRDIITEYPDVQKVGIMATDGTVHANVYGRECAANGIQESVYYYRLNRLRKMALNACETPDSTKDHDPSGTFAQISVASTVQTSNAAIRIRRGDTVMEVSRDAPDRILSFLKEVMFRAL